MKWCVTCNGYQKAWSEVCKSSCGNDCENRCYNCNHLFSGELTTPTVNPSTLAMSRQQAQAIGRTLDALVDQNPRNRYTASIEVNPKTGKIDYSISAERK